MQIVGTTSARHCPLRPPLTLAPIEAGTVRWADMTAHVSAAHAARMYGRSEKTVRRWIASGKLPAEKVDGVYLVSTAAVAELVGDVSAPIIAQVSAPGTDSMSTQGADTDVRPDEEDVRPSERPGLDIMRAEAMAAYTRSLLEPLVQTIERQANRVAELERENGRQAAELEAMKAARTSAVTPGGVEAHETASGASMPRWRLLWPLWAFWMAVAVVVALVVVLVWPR